MKPPDQMPAQLIRLPAVLNILKISRAAFYAGVKIGRFPAAVRLGPRSVAWKLNDVLTIVENGVSK